MLVSVFKALSIAFTANAPHKTQGELFATQSHYLAYKTPLSTLEHLPYEKGITQNTKQGEKIKIL